MAKKQKRGDGSVHLRKDGRWEGRYVVGRDEKGLPATKNVLAKTRAECQEKLKKLRESIEKPAPETVKPGMTFGAWLDLWYQNHSKPALRPSTQAGYEISIYRHIIPELGGIPLDRLDRNDLQQFYTRLKESGRLIRAEQYGEGLSDRTVRLCHVICHAALLRAVEEGLIRADPSQNCKLPPKRAREMQVLTHEEMQRLMVQAKEDGCYELMMLELSTGLRRGEILALRWDDLNFKTGELRVERQVNRIGGKLTISPPKTKASIRTVILPSPVVEVLRKYKADTASRWMFPSPVKEDAPRDPSAVRKKLQKLLERAQCKKIRYHDLRHTFSTAALEHGMDIKTLSAVIGHGSAATTLDVYAHVTDEMRQKAAARIDRGIAKAEPKQRKTSAPKQPPLQAAKGKYRKPGTGCVSRINDHLWEGRYSPKVNGVRIARNVYAHTEAECEEKLAELIVQMKAEIAEMRKTPVESRAG